jgi:hypothetical protein
MPCQRSLVSFSGGSSNGRTADSESVCGGSNPPPPAWCPVTGKTPSFEGVFCSVVQFPVAIRSPAGHQVGQAQAAESVVLEHQPQGAQVTLELLGPRRRLAGPPRQVGWRQGQQGFQRLVG